MLNNVREWRKIFKGVSNVREQLPMQEITSFHTGGPAELVLRPHNRKELAQILSTLSSLGQVPTVLGGCTNVLVADSGIPGVTIRMDQFEQDLYHLSSTSKPTLRVSAGMPISDLAWGVSHHGLGGLACFYRLPGTLGGAVWMNASCYGASIGAITKEVVTMDYQGNLSTHTLRAKDFSYKHSPFQKKSLILLEVTLELEHAKAPELIGRMKEIEQDRITKGHFSYPSAGSVFKNMPNIEKPVGSLLDSLGVKGYAYGNAKVADYHANIVVNHGMATSAEIAQVIAYLQERCKDELGYDLEREIQYIGSW